MAIQKLKRPRDTLELAKLIGDIATGETEDGVEDNKDPIAVGYGRKGGKERSEKLTPAQRTAIAKEGAKARWDKKD